jgi:hypothetical protein
MDWKIWYPYNFVLRQMKKEGEKYNVEIYILYLSETLISAVTQR